MSPFDPKAEYLYRGTTLGWLGTRANQMLPMTCTSTDPLVATLFALECLFRGHSVVQFIDRASVARFAGSVNYFDDEEKAVNLRMKPVDLAEYVIHFIDADDAREILFAMGFDRVAYQIYGLDSLGDELELTHRVGHRLDREQIERFNRAAFEINS